MVKYCSRWETNCEIVKHEDTIKKKGRRYVNTETLEYLETSNDIFFKLFKWAA